MMKKNGKIKNEAEQDMRRSEDYIINNTSNIITSADEKTHGFNRVDDSPQIF